MKLDPNCPILLSCHLQPVQFFNARVNLRLMHDYTPQRPLAMLRSSCDLYPGLPVADRPECDHGAI